MKIAGIIKSSWIDYPGKASTVIFLSGCNFRCSYCHNPELVLPDYGKALSPVIPVDEFFAFLQTRKNFLDAVCISGGEPTLHPDLPDFIREIKRLGFAVKLDTNGTNPDMLKELIEEGLLDYVAMDIKGPSDLYEKIIGVPVNIEAIKESANILMEASSKNSLKYEFRTTVCRELLKETDLCRMIKEYPERKTWFLQTFKNPGTILDKNGQYSAYSDIEMKEMAERLCVSVR